MDDFEKSKPIIYKDSQDTNDENCKLMLKTEIHFTVFHLIETLFEMIFALEKLDDSQLWYDLSFSSNDNYYKIRKIAEGETDFLNNPVKITKKNSNEEIEISFLEHAILSRTTNC